MASLFLATGQNAIMNMTDLTMPDNTTFGITQSVRNVSKNHKYKNLTDPSLELSLESQIGLVILYTATIAVSVTGNSIVVAVLLLGNRSKTELSLFLLNLAFADLCMACFCMPFTFTGTMLGRWIFGEAMCPLALFMQITSVAVSVLTNMAIGIDRFWAVVHPLRTRLTKTKAKVLILLTWIMSMGLASPQLAVAHQREVYWYSSKLKVCGENWAIPVHRTIYSMFITAFTYVIPLIVLAYTYYEVGRVLWERIAPGNADAQRDYIQLKAKKKVTQMLVTVVVVFAICWLPLHLFNLILDFAPQLLDGIHTKLDEHLYYGVYYGCHWLAMANSFANPVIYGFLNEGFRADLRYIFRRCPCRHCHKAMKTFSTRRLTLQTFNTTNLKSFRTHRSARYKNRQDSQETKVIAFQDSNGCNSYVRVRPEILSPEQASQIDSKIETPET